MVYRIQLSINMSCGQCGYHFYLHYIWIAKTFFTLKAKVPLSSIITRTIGATGLFHIHGLHKLQDKVISTKDKNS